MKDILFFLCFFSLSCFTSYPQWIRQTNGIPANWSNTSSIDACNNLTAVIAGYNPYILKTENGGSSWSTIDYPALSSTFQNFTMYENIGDITIIDNLHFWICTDAGRILATSDDGVNWSVQFYDTTKTNFMDFIKMFDLNNGIAMGDAINSNPALFLSTTDGGKNWLSVNGSAFQGCFSGDMWRRMDFYDINNGYFFESGINPQKLYKTTNGCRNWIVTNFPFESAMLVKFYNNNLGLVSTQAQSGWKIFQTLDGGNSWNVFPINAQGWANDLEFLPGDPSKVWYVDSKGLYFSRDTGRTWVEQKIYNGTLSGRDIVFTDSTHGWLICDSGKVFHTINNGVVMVAINKPENSTPLNYMLAQNYPNPFNPSTVISWQLKKSSFVTLKIYNILGKEVATLVNEYQKTGKHSITFDTQQLSEGNFTSGIYFYRMQAGEVIETKKLVLLK
jgi:photosystem II stability/assembly factor-like uncharacterized protein